MADREHEWLTVKNRRWCLTCLTFQHRANERAPWQPHTGPVCAWDTPYAERKLAAEPSP